MSYDFDRIIERTNTDSVKYDSARRWGVPDDALPLWVADMDFQAPSEVLDALVAKSQYGIFGYSESRDAYFEAIASWYERFFSWQLKPEWMVSTPGVVFAVSSAVRAFTEPGDAVLIQEPVYYPFRSMIEMNGRVPAVNQLVYDGAHYSIDFASFEETIVRDKVKLFILCSPHNPVGRVWKRDELLQLGEICLRHQVIIVADEIHADFTFAGHRHQVFTTLNDDFSRITVTCTAPSKTFNLAGLQISNIFIADATLREKFRRAVNCTGYFQPNIMGIVACQTAYQYGHTWLEELKAYLQQNLNTFRSLLKCHVPGAVLIEPEGTYLLWVDFSKVDKLAGFSGEQLDHFMVHEAKLWLDGGTLFGLGGEGFQRFNIACPRSVLEEAFMRLGSALQRL